MSLKCSRERVVEAKHEPMGRKVFCDGFFISKSNMSCEGSHAWAEHGPIPHAAYFRTVFYLGASGIVFVPRSSMELYLANIPR